MVLGRYLLFGYSDSTEHVSVCGRVRIARSIICVAAGPTKPLLEAAQHESQKTWIAQKDSNKTPIEYLQGIQ